MQDLFYLETLHEQIFIERTKEYFNEVISSYHNGNYRSAIVMLWSIVVFDLLYKMEQLDSVYDDEKAKKIVDEVRKKQESNPKSSEWELYLINEVFKTGKIIDKTCFESLKYLQQIRHLSAHPVIKDDLSIYQPDREMARAMIKMALENVFVKPTMYIDGVFDKILKNLSENKEILSSYEDVKRFIKYKYLDKLNENDKCAIFKSLWKIVFYLDNDDCNKNRVINARFLLAIIENDEKLILDYARNNKDYFCKIKYDKQEIFSILVQIINKNNKIYNIFSDDFKIIIKSILANDKTDNFIMGYFVFDSFSEYFENLNNLIAGRNLFHKNIHSWRFLFDKCLENGYKDEFIKSISDYYSLSGSYDIADYRFELIKEFIDNYSTDNFKYLLKKSEDNYQTYGRTRNVKNDYQFLKDKILETDNSFDFTEYENFNRVLMR